MQCGLPLPSGERIYQLLRKLQLLPGPFYTALNSACFIDNPIIHTSYARELSFNAERIPSRSSFSFP